MYFGHIYVPPMDFFSSGNIYAGSVKNDFNYRIACEKSGDKSAVFKSAVWFGTVCFDNAVFPDKQTSEQTEGSDRGDLSPELFENEFSESGYADMISRINERLDRYLASDGG